jgi:hypothetical protein
MLSDSGTVVALDPFPPSVLTLVLSLQESCGNKAGMSAPINGGALALGDLVLRDSVTSHLIVNVLQRVRGSAVLATQKGVRSNGTKEHKDSTNG